MAKTAADVMVGRVPYQTARLGTALGSGTSNVGKIAARVGLGILREVV